jgi:hypothetical protein
VLVSADDERLAAYAHAHLNVSSAVTVQGLRCVVENMKEKQNYAVWRASVLPPADAAVPREGS